MIVFKHPAWVYALVCLFVYLLVEVKTENQQGQRIVHTENDWVMRIVFREYTQKRIENADFFIIMIYNNFLCILVSIADKEDQKWKQPKNSNVRK